MATAKSTTVYEPIVCSTSKLISIPFTYQWTVEKFIDFLDRQYEISSEKFVPTPSDGSEWKLVLFNKHLYPEGPHLAVSLVKLSNDNKPHGIKYTISLITDNNYPNCMQTREKIFHQPLDSDDCVISSHGELIKKKLLQRPQKSNLIIRCEMDMLLVENSTEDPFETTFPSAKRRGSIVNNLSSPSSSSMMDLDVKMEFTNKTNNLYYFQNNLSDDELKTSFAPTPLQNDESLNALSDDFGLLYLKKHSTDFTVVVEGKSIGAHKAVLSARSDFFRTATKGNEVCITGIRSVVMDAVLYYLYTGKTHPLTVDLALDMLRAAKRFYLQPLQKVTESFLKSNIMLENVIDVLEVADELNMDDLKHTCLKFVSYNDSDLQQTEKWRVVLKKNPRIAGQVLLAIASARGSNVLS